MPRTPSDHQTTHITSTLGLSISAVCVMGMHVGVQAEPPMVVTSLETSATAEGTGYNEEILQKTFPTGTSDYSDGLVLEDTSSGVDNRLEAAFSLLEGSLIESIITHTSDYPQENGNLYGAAIIEFDLLKDTILEVSCTGAHGRAWRIGTVVIDAPRMQRAQET